MLVSSLLRKNVLSFYLFIFIFHFSQSKLNFNDAIGDDLMIISQTGELSSSTSFFQDSFFTSKYEDFDLENLSINLKTKVSETLYLLKTGTPNYLYVRTGAQYGNMFKIIVSKSSDNAASINSNAIKVDELAQAITDAGVKTETNLKMPAFELMPIIFENFEFYVGLLSKNVKNDALSNDFPVTNANQTDNVNSIINFIQTDICQQIFNELNKNFKLKLDFQENLDVMLQVFNTEFNNESVNDLITFYIQNILDFTEKRAEIISKFETFLLLNSFMVIYFNSELPIGLTSNVEVGSAILEEYYKLILMEAYEVVYDKYKGENDEKYDHISNMVNEVFTNETIIQIFRSVSGADDQIKIDPKKKARIFINLRNSIYFSLRHTFYSFKDTDLGKQVILKFGEYMVKAQEKWESGDEFWTPDGIDLPFFRQLFMMKHGMPQTFDEEDVPLFGATLVDVKLFTRSNGLII